MGRTLAVVLALAVCGCQDQKFSATVFNPFRLRVPFLPQHDPVRIGVSHDDQGVFDPTHWDLGGIGSPWEPLRQRLEQELDRPVQIDHLEPFQLGAHLQSGRIDFALLGARDYLAAAREFGELGRVVAFSEPARRQGLIVCRTTADIKSLQDIKGRRFSFGPPGDPVLDAAAKETLIEAGVPLDELIREWLALDAQTGVTVYSQQYHISSRESAFSIVYGLLTEVGVIESAEHEAYPETGGSLLLRQFAKEDFRVLGRTRVVRMDSLPEGPLLAASDADPQLVERVVAFLLSINATDRGVLLAAGLGSFRAPGADVAAEMERLAALSPSSAPADQ